MVAFLIVAIVLLIWLYVGWGERLRTFRRPAEGSESSGELIVEYTPEKDLSTEASEELGLEIPEADIDFSRHPEFHEDYVTLLARDSDTLFAYWEVTFEAVDRYSRATGDRARPRVVLRIYDAQDMGETSRWIDIEVNSRLGNYYLQVPMRCGAYYAEIGLIGSSGFWPVARSGLTAVPRSVFGGTHLDEYAARARAGLGVSSW